MDKVILLSRYSKWDHDEHHWQSPENIKKTIIIIESQYSYCTRPQIGKEWVERMSHFNRNRSLLHSLQNEKVVPGLCTLIIETESSCAFAYINTTEVSLFNTGVGQ